MMNSRYPSMGLLLLITKLMFMTMLSVRPSITYACSCAMSASPQEALEQSAAVFSGEVVSLKETRKVIQSSADPVQVTFKVESVWKGRVGDTVTLSTAQSSASCGFEFADGNSYLVYANGKDGEDGELQASLCSRTMVLSGAAEDIAALGQGLTPTMTPASQTPELVENAVNGSDPSVAVYVGSGVTILALLVGVIIFRYRTTI